MKVRKAIPTDESELIKLYKEFNESTKGSLSDIQNKFRELRDVSKYSKDKIQKYLTNPDYLVFVAEDDDNLIGYISGKINESPERVNNKEGYLENWFVKKSSRSKGVGKELFDSLVKEFKKQKCTHIGVDTHLEYKDTIKIYEHLGFTKRLVTFFKFLE